MKKLIIIGTISLMVLTGCTVDEESLKEDCVEVKDFSNGTSSLNTSLIVYSKINENEYQLSTKPSHVRSMRNGNLISIRYSDKMSLIDFDFVKSCERKEER